MLISTSPSGQIVKLQNLSVYWDTGDKSLSYANIAEMGKAMDALIHQENAPAPVHSYDCDHRFRERERERSARCLWLRCVCVCMCVQRERERERDQSENKRLSPMRRERISTEVTSPLSLSRSLTPSLCSYLVKPISASLRAILNTNDAPDLHIPKLSLNLLVPYPLFFRLSHLTHAIFSPFPFITFSCLYRLSLFVSLFAMVEETDDSGSDPTTGRRDCRPTGGEAVCLCAGPSALHDELY